MFNLGRTEAKIIVHRPDVVTEIGRAVPVQPRECVSSPPISTSPEFGDLVSTNQASRFRCFSVTAQGLGEHLDIRVFSLVATAHVVTRRSSSSHHAAQPVISFERLPFYQTYRSAHVVLRTELTSSIPASIDANI